MARIRSHLVQSHSATRPGYRTTVPDPIKPVKATARKVSFGGRTFTASPIFDTFFWFVAERHRIHQLRVAGKPRPWTEDTILAEHPFTNVFRVYDRVTQYILQNVIGKGSRDLYESCFRVLLFRTFNRIETWEYLEEQLGDLTWRDFDVRQYEKVLSKVDGALYGPVYIIPAPGFGWPKNYSNHLRLIQMMMQEDIPKALKRFQYLKDAHGYICMYPGVGDFTGFQYILDLNMLPHFDWSENEWAALGPGSTSCLVKMFGKAVHGHEDAAMRYLRDTQLSHFTRLGIHPDQIPRLCGSRGAGLSIVDIEHALCECDKYSRGAFPEIRGRRTSLHRKWVPDETPVTADLPSKWRNPLRPAPSLPKPPAVFQNEGDWPCYEVSHIVAEKKADRGKIRSNKSSCYLVRWSGYGPEEDTWMSENDLTEGAAEVLAAWRCAKERIERKVAQLRATRS
ncbi:hypothetical protein K474DRAFT_1666813 [Panus rudis PR-1116 ss-1]|nr:hypothetical protein K474DRAFT_1666813 [Panus rudis PR-1116 ss-1]